MIAVIGAMDQEVALLRETLKARKEETTGPFTFIRGEHQGRDVVLAQCGIGKVNAALCTGLILERYQPHWVINTGSAGGLLPQQTMGDVVISSQALYHDVDVTGFGYKSGQIPGHPEVFTADDELIRVAEEALDRRRDQGLFQGSHTRGVVGTGDQFVHKGHHIDHLKGTFPAMACVEMEGASIAHTCWMWKTPFVIIRALSDIAGKDSPMLFKDFLPLAAKNSAALVLDMIAHL